MVEVLMMSAKLATLDLLKFFLKYFKIKVMRSPTNFYHVTPIILFDVVIWPELGNSRTSMRGYHNVNFKSEKPFSFFFFFEECCCFKFNNLEMALSRDSKFYTSFGNYFPANIRLDEEVLNTSFVFVFRRRLEDLFKTSWPRRICSP